MNKLHALTASPGKYALTLYFGGDGIDKPETWAVGTFDLKFDAVILSGEARQAQDILDSYFLPFPEIHHIFRDDPKMPPVVISLTFSGLVLSPWLLLLFAVCFVANQ